MNAARRYGWLAVALCIGAIAIFWRLTDQSLFLDEAFTLAAAAQPVPQLLATVAASDNSPPLFHLISHALALLRLPAWDYRFFVAPFGLVTIAATWGVAQRLFGERVAAVAALACATSPLLVDWDRMYRMYAPFVALSILSWWLLILIQESEARDRRPALVIAYALSAACVPLLHYVGLVVLASQLAYAVARPRARWPVVAACVLVALGFALWLPGLREQTARGGSLVLASEIGWPGVARNLFAAYLPVGVAAVPAVDWIISALALGVIAAGLWLGRSTPLPFMLAPALLQVAASAILGKNLVNPRYLLYAQPLFALCLGAISFAGEQLRLAGFAVALVAIASNLAGLQNLLLDPYYQRSDWYSVATLLVANEHRDDAIVLDQGYMHYVVDDLNGFRGHASYRIESDAAVRDAAAWLRAHARQRVWYVENQFYYPDPQRAVLATLRASRPVLGTYQQRRASEGDRVNVVLFGPQTPPKGLKRGR